MVNDILLETWTNNGETTGLLSDKKSSEETKTVYSNFHVKLFIVLITFSVLVMTFVISVVNFISDDDFNEQTENSVRSFSLQSMVQNDVYFIQCAPIVTCDSTTKYRSANGTCNNLNNPIWGSSNTPYIRLIDAHYSDEISKLRLSVDGRPLPSARKIQVQLFLNKQLQIGDTNNQLLMQWGQFVAHDVSSLAIDSNGEDCCLYENQSRNQSRACEATIQIPIDDPVYSKYNKTCMRFNRAMTSFNYNCPLQPSTFMNDATQYIDGSQIYGSNDYISSTLRSFAGGTLKSDVEDGQEFCPHSTIESPPPDTNKYFYNSGDARANLNPGLALFHNMFLRFHNFVAYKLKSAKSEWTDETLFQESRKIVGAVIQHITYTQFLPIILGKNYTADRVVGDDNKKYNPAVNPSTTQEFSAGAFRVLHNIIPAQHKFIDSNYTTVRTINVTDWMNRPYIISQNVSNFDDLLRGLMLTEGRLKQPSYNPLISNLMFRSNNSTAGVDLLSYDIQRGRDTGLPPYNKMRELCGLPVAKSFGDLVDIVALDDIYDLEKLYYSVDDVDFIVGALLEIPEDDALVGNTTRCIIADFFYRSRVGDRFFYDNDEQFSKDQLETLKKINLDHVICATSSVDYLQNDIFTKFGNGWYSPIKWTCDEKYKIDFKPWEEEHYD